MLYEECVIVDIDGTLAEFDAEAVRQWVLSEEKQWLPFFEHMAQALPSVAISRLVGILSARRQKIVICSGRPASFQHYTQTWLEQHSIPFDALYLRPDDEDHLPDEVVKKRLLQRIREDGYQPWLVIDDRQAVVDFWRAEGLTCLQCAPGDF